jgi:hypothetical protein
MRQALASGVVLLCCLCDLPLSASPAPLQREAATASSAVRVAGPPSDADWQVAPLTSGFVQREPAEGSAPSQRTDFRVLFDATTLFVRVRAFDSEPHGIITYLTRRDVESPCDWIRVLIDSYHDRRTAYEFAVNPSGVKQDGYWYNDTERDDSWDAVWDVVVGRDSDGWSAEFHIPFSQLRFTPGPATTFGFAVSRQVGRLNETSSWPLLARSANGYVSSFGELGGLSMTASPKRLELVPYTVADLTTKTAAGNPLLERWASNIALGLDARYALTSGLTLTATLNPDFGQVEADPAVVNLSAFETFFPERRPFFVEGSGTFAFGLDCGDCGGLFYSRRIGRSPQGSGELPDGDGIHTDFPVQTTILGAAKLTGRVGTFSVGALHAATGHEQGLILESSAVRRQPIEPSTHYSVARVRRDFANQSSVGFMLTTTNRRVDNETDFLARHAHAGGVDVDWRIGSRYSVSGNWVGSHISGSTDAIDRLQRNSRHYFQRPDAGRVRLDPTSTVLAGTAGRLGFGKIGGARVRFQSNVGFKTPGFDVNDLGFLQRADERTLNNWLQIRSDTPTRWFRTRNVNFNQYARWNFDGQRLSSGGNVNAHAIFINNWELGGGYNLNQTQFDDRLSRGGPGGNVEGYRSGWFYVNSDDRRQVTLNYEGSLGGDGHGSWFRNFEPRVTLRPTPPLNVSAGIRVGRDVIDSQWVAKESDPNDHYVFGRLDQTTVALTTRVSYTVTPNVSLQLYAEPFVSGGKYTHFKELVDGPAREYAKRYAPFDATTTPDFNVKSFRTTNVLRWEYRRGSTLFLVWQQARDHEAASGDFRFSRDVRGIFDLPATNVLLVKFAYWLNF